MTIDSEISAALDVLLEADFLGRAQSLTLEEAEARLLRSIRRRAENRMPGNLKAINEIEQRALNSLALTPLSYRSVAYDAAGLTATLVRMYAGSEYEIVEAHMALMRSMILNAPEPDIGPLRLVMAKLITGE